MRGRQVERLGAHFEPHAERCGQRVAVLRVAVLRERPMAFATVQRLRRFAEGAGAEFEVLRAERDALAWSTREA